MAFLEQLSDLCSKEEPTDLLLQSGSVVHYFQDNRLKVSKLMFAKDDVPELLHEAGCKEWGPDKNLAFQAGKHRLRANFFKSMDNCRVVLRRLPSEIPTVEKLGLPKQFIESVVNSESGLILVCGPMGSGKSTSCAASVQARLMKRDDHCVTIESPIEYILKGRYELQVSQREVGKCVESYAVGLQSALRQYARTILVQEISDPESALTAVKAAMTGNLVISTLHTGKVSLSIEALMNLMPESMKKQVQSSLPEVLRGVMCQRLLKREDGKGRFAIHELMMPHDAVKVHIKKGNFSAIDQELEVGAPHGHQTFKQSLRQAISNNYISSNGAQIIEKSL